MKTALTVNELALELKRRAAAAIDITSPTRNLRLAADRDADVSGGRNRPAYLELDGASVNELGVPDRIGVTEVTHRQISAHLGVPFKFYQRVRQSHPDLLELNVNSLFERESKNRLVRTLDGSARAFLSNNYNVALSDLALAEYLLPAAAEVGCVIRSSSITDIKAYIKLVTPNIEREVRRVGDIIRFGVTLYNSEVGFGKWGFDLFTENLTCTNGATVEKSGFAKSHIGKALGDGESVRRFLTDETRAAEDKALMLGSRDVMRGLLTEAKADEHIALLERAAETPLVKGVGDQREKVAENVTRITHATGLTEVEGASVLDHLINVGNLTVYGLANAVTRAAEDSPSYDRASELEVLGGRMMTLPRDQWRSIGDATGDESLALDAD